MMQYGTEIASLITRVEARRLVADLYNQGMPIKEIATKVPVSLATVYRWINLPKHKSIKQKSEPKTEDFAAGGDSTKSVNSSNSNCETALLEAQIKELKAQLRAAELKACAYETMVNVAEKKFGIAIRKNHGAKQ
jgi:transposase-like protein